MPALNRYFEAVPPDAHKIAAHMMKRYGFI